MDFDIITDSNLVSACGLYCGTCGVYIATQANDTKKILYYAKVLSQSYVDTLCDGCNSDRKSMYRTYNDYKY